MDIREEDKMHLLGIADSIREIQGYIGQGDWRDYSQDSNEQQAISSHLQQIGSAAALLSDEFKDKFRDVDWDVLKGFQYANYDQELELDYHPQWHIIKEDLPIFLEQIEDLLTEIQREETLEDDLTLTGSDEDKYQLDPDSEEYQNRRSGDQLGEDLEDFVLSDEDDNILDRLEVIGDNIVGESDEIREVPLGDLETEDDSFIDKRYEDVDLMKDSSLDDDLEDGVK
jgi:uncharacterized protein with HEPN domain